MILGELKDKSEAQQAFARMFPSLFHDLVTNAKMQRIQFLKQKKFLQECSQICPKFNSRCNLFFLNLETQEAYARMLTNLLRGLVIDAKAPKKILETQQAFVRMLAIQFHCLVLLGSICKMIKNKILGTQEASTKILTNLSMIW